MTNKDTKLDTDNMLKDAFKKTDEFHKYQGLLVELAQKLKPAQVRFANMVVSGMNPTQAYKEIKDGKCADKTAYTQGRNWMQNETIRLYIDKAREFAVVNTMHKADYTEQDWMETQMKILSMSLGERTIKKVILDDGTAYEADLREANLPQANKSQELIAKRFGWLQDNLKVSGRTTLNMVRKDMTGSQGQSKTPDDE